MSDRILNLASAAITTGARPSARIDLKPGKENIPVHIRGITTATVAIEGSLDNVNWRALRTETADFIGLVPAFPFMRANVTAWTAGTIHVNIFADRTFTP